jgi:hypothetical protein
VHEPVHEYILVWAGPCRLGRFLYFLEHILLPRQRVVRGEHYLKRVLVRMSYTCPTKSQQTQIDLLDQCVVYIVGAIPLARRLFISLKHIGSPNKTEIVTTN